MDAVQEQEEVRYRERTPRSRALWERARGSLAGGSTRALSFWRPYPLFVDRASGSRLVDVDGNEYVDCANNATALVHGHSHPAIDEAVAAERGRRQAVNAGLEPQVELAELLRERVPSVDLVRFCNSGTEATMLAVRAARAFTGRDTVVKLAEAYHGTNDALLGGRGVPASATADVLEAPFDQVEPIEELVHAHAVAAVIVEPAPGRLGYPPPSPGYLEALRNLCTDAGALLVFDEVQTLRLAPGGAQERFGVVPDLTAMAKIIGGGYPVGALGGRADVMGVFDPTEPDALSLGGTFNGNVATMTAGLVSLELLTREAIERIDRLGETLAAHLRNALAELGVPGRVLGVGSLRHVALEAPAAGPLLHLALLNEGVFWLASNSLNTSTAMTDEDVEAVASGFQRALARIRPLAARA